MKIGIPYRLGDGPVLMDVPIIGKNGFSTCSHTVPLEGELRNVYAACQQAASERDSQKSNDSDK